MGGDGYVGWPLSVRLALRYPNQKFLIVDNFLRRKLVSEVGGDSLIPVLSLADRIKMFSGIFTQNNLSFIEMNVMDQGCKALIQEKLPKVIYHLAQQPSAHYSMRGVNESIFTVENNELGNLKLLWNIKNHSPETHLIKLGSFGEYAECGLDIAEGYFSPTYRGRQAFGRTPFPREADDVYHVSKINDSNFISMACRKWNLKITDIMQSTIFGNKIDEFNEHHGLYTRFDYDEFFGTVINRFLVQSISSLPMSVYGSGHQRNGLMSIEDATFSLANLFDSSPKKGEHKVINHVVEKKYSVNELAEVVEKVYHHVTGKKANISRGEFDPRHEQLNQKKKYSIETTYIQESMKTHTIKEVIEDTIQIVADYKDRVIQKMIHPSFQWF